jgi:hypothetical protein
MAQKAVLPAFIHAFDIYILRIYVVLSRVYYVGMRD